MYGFFLASVDAFIAGGKEFGQAAWHSSKVLKLFCGE